MVDASGTLLGGVVSADAEEVGVLGGGTHFVQTVEVLVIVSVETVLVVCTPVEEPLVTVSVTGQVVKVVTTTSVVTTGTVVPGTVEPGAVEPGAVEPGAVDEATGVVVSGVVVEATGVLVSEVTEELAGAVESGTEGIDGVEGVATDVSGVVVGTGGEDTGVVVLAGME